MPGLLQKIQIDHILQFGTAYQRGIKSRFSGVQALDSSQFMSGA